MSNNKKGHKSCFCCGNQFPDNDNYFVDRQDRKYKSLCYYCYSKQYDTSTDYRNLHEKEISLCVNYNPNKVIYHDYKVITTDFSSLQFSDLSAKEMEIWLFLDKKSPELPIVQKKAPGTKASKSELERVIGWIDRVQSGGWTHREGLNFVKDKVNELIQKKGAQ